MLNKAVPVPVNAEDYVTLDTFRNAYLILFGCLDATLGLMSANSWIAKKMYGGMQDSFNASESLVITDSQRSYITNIQYLQYDTRRCLIREKYIKNKKAPISIMVLSLYLWKITIENRHKKW